MLTESVSDFLDDRMKNREQQETKREEMKEEAHDFEDIEEEELYKEDWDSDKSD